MFISQDLLPELQAVCQCFEAVAPVFVKVVPSENMAEANLVPPAPDVNAEPQCTRRKRKVNENDGPAKKIVGDGTRSLTTPVSWMSWKTEIVIR